MSSMSRGKDYLLWGEGRILPMRKLEGKTERDINFRV